MKRNKIIAVVLAVLMMAGALVLASCDKGKECSYGECAVENAACTDSSCAVVKENDRSPEEGTRDKSIKCDCE